MKGYLKTSFFMLSGLALFLSLLSPVFTRPDDATLRLFSTSDLYAYLKPCG